MSGSVRNKIRRGDDEKKMEKIAEIELRQSKIEGILTEIQTSQALTKQDIGYIKENIISMIDENKDKIKIVSKLSVKNKDKINMHQYLFIGAVGLGGFIITILELTK